MDYLWGSIFWDAMLLYIIMSIWTKNTPVESDRDVIADAFVILVSYQLFFVLVRTELLHL